jgi:hypothetical protein
MAIMGNSLVPDCARFAFLFLLNGFNVTDVGTKTVSLQNPEPLRIRPTSEPKWCGFATREGTFSVAHKVFKRPALDLQLIGPLVQQPGPKVSTPLLIGTVNCISWNTPRHAVLSSCKTLTQRSARDLPTQMRFERDTPEEQRDWPVNPDFVEWLMGHPLKSTLIC